ncbi:OmpH family outer membrane protein [Pacificimonas sp. ICDLI1SI03]|jgi:Skp family chaperone for outer membrane proteins|tara:strand:- start:75407 stop:76060 length:654 start_codon:yes stop_codon:yes gene_type:complete
MTKFKALLSGTAFSMAVLTAPAFPALAQAQAVAIISPEGAIQGTTAFQNAQTAIRTTYASQISNLETRVQALQAELTTARTNFENARSQPNATDESVRPSAMALQQLQARAQQEQQQLQQPIALANSYATEQIEVHLDEAVRAAMTAKNVDLVLRPEAVVAMAPGGDANLTDEVVAELNRRIQSVTVQPPADWEPGDTMRAARPQQQAPAAAQPPAQ